MKTWIITALAFVLGMLLLTLCPQAQGSSCAVRTRTVVTAPVVVKDVVAVAAVVPVAVFTPIAIAVPAYTASYVPPAPAPAPAPAQPSADTKAIIDALKALDTRLQAIEKGGGSIPPGKQPDPFNPAAKGTPAPAPGKGPAVFAAKCASCHQRGKESDGGGFVLMETDGTPSKLEAKGVLSVVRKSYAGVMPPKSSKIPPLTDGEVGEIVAWSESAK